MRYPREHRDETRARMLAAAGRHFREQGYDGVGIDGLARAAEVTSGAFYGHFKSKAAAFHAVVIDGLSRLGAGIARFQARDGAAWLAGFSRFYLGAAHRRDVGGGCALPSLSPEIARADPTTRAGYQAELIKIAETMAAGLPGAPGRAASWSLLAQLLGGVILSRAVPDPALQEEIAQAVLEDLLRSR